MTARPRKGTTWSQGRLGSFFPRGGEYVCTKVYWFIRRRRRIIAGVGEYEGYWFICRGEEGAGSPADACLSGWSRKNRD